jgi:DNA-binding NarL/FixJ family response regulator
MARVLALTRDLMFGSRVQSALTAAGHEVQLQSDEARVRELLAPRPASDPVAVLIVDLTDAELDGAGALEALREHGALEGVRTLAFYSHVEADTRARAQRAGFDVIVPRSRMAREGVELLTQLLVRA